MPRNIYSIKVVGWLGGLGLALLWLIISDYRHPFDSVSSNLTPIKAFLSTAPLIAEFLDRKQGTG